jgi:Uma2 family endonuclease
MPILIDNPKVVSRILERRRLTGADRYDEVWDGVYVMSPLANNEHQRIGTRFATILDTVIGLPGLGEVRSGVNVSDRAKGWRKNCRVPDIAVRLNGGLAKMLTSHWVGGPDFVVEIVSNGDRSRRKLDFYGAVGTRELLLVDRDPWALELYGLRDGRLVPTGVSRTGLNVVLTSEVLPQTFRLIEPGGVPKIEVAHPESGRSWMV